MIQARHHSLAIILIRMYYRLKFRLHFKKINIVDQVQCGNRPVILTGNHFSWWDGFFADHLNATIFGRKLHIMMLEHQLMPRMFLNKAGAFSINPGSRDVVNSLDYASEVLKDSGNILVLYPQGEIQSQHRQHFTFNSGISSIYRKYILKGGSSDLCLVFYVALTDYLSESKPRVNIYLKEFPAVYLNNIKQLEAAFQAFYMSCIHKQSDQ